MPAYYSANTVPRGALITAAALVLGSLLFVGAMQLSGKGGGSEALAAPVLERSLRFDDLADGGVAVRDAGDGQLIERLEPGTNHFLRAIMRGLVRERLRRGEGDEVPFHLAQRSDGRLTLIDPTSRRIVDLGAFGSSNSGVFVGFLTPRTTTVIHNAAIHPAVGQIAQGSKP